MPRPSIAAVVQRPEGAGTRSARVVHPRREARLDDPCGNGEKHRKSAASGVCFLFGYFFFAQAKKKYLAVAGETVIHFLQTVAKRHRPTTAVGG